MNQSSQRKKDHINICLNEEVSFGKTTGFEKYEFIHHANSEISANEIDLSTEFFGRKISYPFLISSMTGGNKEGEKLNIELARAAEYLNIPIGLGSQRIMLEEPNKSAEFKAIPRYAGNSPILANIGAYEFIHFPIKKIFQLVETVNASALIVHLNLLQEFLQIEGKPNFKGLRVKLKEFTGEFAIPLIVKEVGFGISKQSALELLECGVSGIDVAGAGGTDWGKVENLRSSNPKGKIFENWGLPTSYCIKEVKELKKEYDFILIGSGGINDAMDFAKALALGADLAASARILLKEAFARGTKGVVDLLEYFFDTLKKIMTLTNSKTIKELQQNKIAPIKEFY